VASNIVLRQEHALPGSDRSTRSGRRHRGHEGRKSIVVGLDSSVFAHRALCRAVDVARAHDAHLHIVHARPRALPRFLGRERAHTLSRNALARVTEEVRAKGLSVRAHVVMGSTVAAVRKKVGDLRADLVVVGAGERRLLDAVTGSTAERIASATQRPVLVARRAESRPYRQILVAVGLHSNPQRLHAAAMLVAPSAELCFLHAYDDPYEGVLILHGMNGASLQRRRKELRREASAALTRSMAESGLEGHELLLRNGMACNVIEREERERQANDTLFVLERERSVVDRLVFGTACRWLLSQGESDVLLV